MGHVGGPIVWTYYHHGARSVKLVDWSNLSVKENTEGKDKSESRIGSCAQDIDKHRERATSVKKRICHSHDLQNLGVRLRSHLNMCWFNYQQSAALSLSWGRHYSTYACFFFFFCFNLLNFFLSRWTSMDGVLDMHGSSISHDNWDFDGKVVKKNLYVVLISGSSCMQHEYVVLIDRDAIIMISIKYKSGPDKLNWSGVGCFAI